MKREIGAVAKAKPKRVATPSLSKQRGRKMTDRELEEYLCLTPEEGAVIIPRLSPEKRAAYEMLAAKEWEIVLWQQGVAPFPEGVLVDTDRTVRHGCPLLLPPRRGR